MPSPLGHALGGLLVGLACVPPSPAGGPAPSGRVGPPPPVGWPPMRVLAFAAAMACLPDIDFAWGRHNMETHSLGFAAVAAILTFAATRSSRLSLVALLSVATHVLFDWLGSDDSPPLGVMAFWPLSRAFYFADAFVFDAISRRYWLPGFVQHNVLAMLRELAILLPLVAVAWRARRRG